MKGGKKGGERKKGENEKIKKDFNLIFIKNEKKREKRNERK